MGERIPYPLGYQQMVQQSILVQLEILRRQGRTRELLEMEQALARLHRADFGACEACGAVIAFARIAAHPAARRCAACEATG